MWMNHTITHWPGVINWAGIQWSINCCASTIPWEPVLHISGTSSRSVIRPCFLCKLFWMTACRFCVTFPAWSTQVFYDDQLDQHANAWASRELWVCLHVKHASASMSLACVRPMVWLQINSHHTNASHSMPSHMMTCTTIQVLLVTADTCWSKMAKKQTWPTSAALLLFNVRTETF